MEIKTLIYTFRTVKKSSQRLVEGEHEVRIRMTQGNEKEYIHLGFSSSAANWDEVNELPRPSHPHYRELSKKIYRYLDSIATELTLAEKAKLYISCVDIKRKALNQDIDWTAQDSQLKILELFDKVICDLEEMGNPGYADVFISTRSTVSKLLNNNRFIPAEEREHEKDKFFVAFSKEDHQKYEQLISAGSSESTISLYLRTYYRIWNLAIGNGYCTRDQHPSKFIGFHAYKRIRTKKRSINQDFLEEIINTKFDPGTRIFRSQLLLQFIYYGRGINFGDVCKLKHKDILNKTIHYIRSKNHREYDYTLHPKALEVVEYFKCCGDQSDTGYVFPILYAIHDTPRKVKNRIKSVLRTFNEDLKKMAISVGWERKFTSYSLRHGFATHLRNNKVGISMIKEALGHETEEQTIIYLDNLDDQPIADEINRALVFDEKNVERRSIKKEGIFGIITRKLSHLFGVVAENTFRYHKQKIS